MPRGGNQQILNASTGVSSQAKGLATAQQAQANQQLNANKGLESGILPGYQAMAAGQLPSGEQQQIGTSAASAQDALARRAAATRNPAGFVGGEDQAARDRMSAIGQAGLNEQSAGLSGLAGMYGTDTGLASKMLGLPGQSLDVAGNSLNPGAKVAGQPGFWDAVGGKILGNMPIAGGKGF